MPNYVVSPCGTSLLTGGADNKMRALLVKYANVKDIEDIPDEHRVLLQQRVNIVKENLLQKTPDEVTKCSAELNALVKFYQGKFLSGDYHLLLCTDTWLGEQTAFMICDWLRLQNSKMVVEVKRQKDLQTENLEAFQWALTELAEQFETILPSYRENKYYIVFNLTGGFKSVQGFLQVIAMFYADEIIYVFESGSSLLRIPRLPVKIDLEEGIKKNISLFRLLEAQELDIDQARQLPEMFVVIMDDNVDFSPWGKVVWNRAKEMLYPEQLWPCPVDYIRFSDKFVKQINALAKHQIKEINYRIDQLIKCLKNPGFNPDSLRFHPIEGKKVEPCTHEFYAWTGQKDRIYGYFEENVFVIDRLDDHL
ncbi:MAG: putative CRISPR-associated protein [Desulfonauticus sp.]|nr:putative CRISPR-associated protein [Desulfonauticus sp.]